MNGSVERGTRFRQPAHGMLTLYNFRDVGGLSTMDGRWLPSGLLFRSDAPRPDAAAGLDSLRSLGIRVVVDLRSIAELTDQNVSLAEDITHVAAGMTRIRWVDSGVPATAMPVFLAERYLSVSAVGIESIGRALRALTCPTRKPKVVWCAGGKDRTGVVVALLLALLGVPRADIARDYARSARAMAEIRRHAWRSAVHRPTTAGSTVGARAALRAAASRLSGGIGALANPAPAEAILHFLDGIDATYGGVEAYAERSGIGAAALDVSRNSLLDD